MDFILLVILSFGIYKMAMSHHIMPWKWVMRLVSTFMLSYFAFCLIIVSIYGKEVQHDAAKIAELLTPLMPFVLLYEMLLFFFFRSQMAKYVSTLDQIDKNNNGNNNSNNTPPSPPQQEQKDLSYFR